MCGRFTVRTSPQEVARIFRVERPLPNCPPRFNLAPTQDVLAVRFNPKDGRRHLDLLRWGLVPHWSKDAKGGGKLINARSEGLTQRPTFRDAFAKRRCLIPADGFYEWQVREGGAKQPFAIVPSDAPMFAFAGLWEGWKDPGTGEYLRTCTIVTGAANETMAAIHERMPVILPEANWPAWLGETTAEPGELLALLKPFPAGRMRAYPVSTRVNSVRNDDESLLEPLAH